MPSHYLDQCSLIVNWNLRNKHQWNLNKNTKLFIQENTREKGEWRNGGQGQMSKYTVLGSSVGHWNIIWVLVAQVHEHSSILYVRVVHQCFTSLIWYSVDDAPVAVVMRKIMFLRHLPGAHEWHLLNNMTHWDRVEMDDISQTTFSNVLSSMKLFEFRIKFHWMLFLRTQSTIFEYLFR